MTFATARVARKTGTLRRLPNGHPRALSMNAPDGILVVDDHDLLRLGLRTLLQADDSSGTPPRVYEARSLQAALDTYREHRPHIGRVLLDLELPDAHGLAGLQAFLGEFPSARVVVLSGSTDPGVQRRVLAAGAATYLAKSADLQQVIAYLRSERLLGDDAPPNRAEGVHTGEPAEAADTLKVWTTSGRSVELTPRQVEVLEWVLAGRSNRQIAEATHLSEGTIKNHVSSLLLMFGVRSRAELIAQLR